MAPATESPRDGLLLVDKAPGLTSHDVVSRVRRIEGTRKVGHAGTLDPMATGLLVLGLGRATRLLTYLVGADKTYLATIRLGQATTTDDAEGETTTTAPALLGSAGITTGALEAAVGTLRGPIEQVPSTVSAIKIDGKRAYARARAGEEVTLTARPVTISEFAILDVRPGDAAAGPVVDVDVRVRCSSGTYIRALARDLGEILGVGGHLSALRRTEVGPFDVAAATPITTGEQDPATGRDVLAGRGDLTFLDSAAALRAAFTVREVDERDARALSFGQTISPTTVDGASVTGVVGVIAPDGTAVALVENRGGAAKPVLVLAPA